MSDWDASLLETTRFWEHMTKKEKTPRAITMRVYIGSDMNPQAQAFKAAWKDIKVQCGDLLAPNWVQDPEYLTIECMSRLKFDIADVVTWLLRADVYFILGHIHQGLASHNHVVDMVDMQEQLKRLSHNTGFPSGHNLTCPVFTQDKEGYLKHLIYGDMANHTLIVPLVANGDLTNEAVREINTFCNMHHEGIGYVVKAPFTTNCGYIRFLSSKEGAVTAVRNACLDLHGSIPYVMVQPKMRNRREHKVICWEGVPQFVCSFSGSSNTKSDGGINKSFSEAPHGELFEFVRRAIERVKSKCPALMCEQLFRVDVFQRIDGTLVVNEFESLEAGFPCRKGTWEYQTFAFLRLHLSVEVVNCLKRVCGL